MYVNRPGNSGGLGSLRTRRVAEFCGDGSAGRRIRLILRTDRWGAARRVRSASAEYCDDVRDDGVGVFVFPESKYGPAGGLKCRCLRAVTLGVSFELGGPVFLVHPGLSAMLGAAVPEASIDEHGNAPLGERNVGAY